jgi:hypothetical protein
VFEEKSFVKKHLDTKHSKELANDPKLKKYFDDQMFHNYCMDENRFTNQPSTISTITLSQSHAGRKGDSKRDTKVSVGSDLA